MWEAHTGQDNDDQHQASTLAAAGGILSDDEDVEQSLQRTGALEQPPNGQQLRGWRAGLRSAWVALVVARALARQRLHLLR